MRLTKRLATHSRLTLPKLNLGQISTNLRSHRSLGYAIFGFSLIGYTLLQASSAFTITTIDCQLDFEPCPTEYTAELNQLYHTKLYFTPVAPITQKLTALPNIIDVNFSFRYPDHLAVNLTSNRPTAYVIGQDTTYVVSVDALGRVIGQSEAAPSNAYLVKHSLPLNLRPKDNLSASPLREPIALINVLRYYAFPPMTLTLTSPTTISAQLPQGQKALFTATKDYVTQVTALQQILSVATIDSSTPVIDVRFDQPVLKQIAE